MYMKLSGLETFWTTYREGSLRRAAGILMRSQPALSYQIRDLEAELGAPLFERRGKKLVATETARRLAPQVGEILERLRELARSGRALGSPQKGTLVVTTSHTLTARVLWKAMARFWKVCPDFEVVVEDALTAQVTESVRQGSADLGITLAGEIPEVLESRPLLRFTYYLLLPRRGPWGRFRPRSCAELEKVPLLLGIPRSAYRQWVDGVLDRMGVRRRLRAEIATLETLPRLVRLGLGASILPGYALFEESLEGLRVCSLESAFGSQTLRAVTRKAGYALQAASEFEALLQKELFRASGTFLRRGFVPIP